MAHYLAYSPYHHVKAGVKYPAALFISGDSDTRVDPLHARKMRALLQSANASNKPIILRSDSQSGHVSEARPVSRVVRDSTDELSFLFWRLGEKFHVEEGENLLLIASFQLQGQHGNDALRDLKGGLNVFAQVLLCILQCLQQTGTVLPRGSQ